MEQRAAVDQMLNLREDAAATPEISRENDEARVARQNREALASWAGLGVPVKV